MLQYRIGRDAHPSDIKNYSADQQTFYREFLSWHNSFPYCIVYKTRQFFCWILPCQENIIFTGIKNANNFLKTENLFIIFEAEYYITYINKSDWREEKKKNKGTYFAPQLFFT